MPTLHLKPSSAYRARWTFAELPRFRGAGGEGELFVRFQSHASNSRSSVPTTGYRQDNWSASPRPWPSGSSPRQARRRNHARSSPVRPRRRARRAACGPDDHQPTDAVIRLAATCVCGSDLWPYRGIEASQPASPDGSRIRRRRRGSRPRGARPSSRASSSSARSSPPTTPVRSAGPATSPRCVHREPIGAIGTQAELAPDPARRRHPGRHRRGCPTPTWSRACWRPPTCSAPAGSAPSPPRPAQVRRSPSSATARSACSPCWPPSSCGAERIIAMSRHEPRQKLAREFGATDIVNERGDEGVARIKDLTGGLRRALGRRGRRHPGVDDAGHPLHPPRRPRRLRRRRPRRANCPARSCSSPRSTCTAARPGAPLPARA